MKLELAIFTEGNIKETLHKFEDRDTLIRARDKLKNMVGNAWFFEQCELSGEFDVPDLTVEKMQEFGSKSFDLEERYGECLERVDKVYEELVSVLV